MSDDTGGSIGYFEAQAIRTIVREEIEKALAKIMRRPTKRPPDRAKSAVKKSSSVAPRKSTRRGR